MRHKAFRSYLMLASALTLVGCGKSATAPGSAASSDGNAGNAAATSTVANAPSTGDSSTQSATASANNAPAPSLAEPKPLVLKAGKKIVITADESVSSKTSNPGDRFEASIAEPVVIGDRVVIPKGAKATGTVIDAKSAGKFKGNAAISVTLKSVTVHGEEYRLKTTEVTESGKGRGKRTAVGAGGGAAFGAIVGALAGGGKGAAIGAGAGAGAGTAGAAFTGDRDIVIQPETRLTFELQEPVEVRKK